MCEHGQLTTDASERVQIASNVRTHTVLTKFISDFNITNSVHRLQLSWLNCFRTGSMLIALLTAHVPHVLKRHY